MVSPAPRRRPSPRGRRAGWAAVAALAVAAGCSSPSRAAEPSRTSAPTASATGPAGPTTTGRTAARPPAAGPAAAGPGDLGRSAAPAGAAPWTTYQDGAAHLGVTDSPPPAPPLARAWSAPLDGAAVYGQPLYDAGAVVVATEADDLYALDPVSGAVRWRVRIGAPLRHVTAVTGCGDIDPLGVTSTPVIDRRAGIVYAVGETSTGGSPPVHFTLVAVDLAAGRVIRRSTVDPPLPRGESPLHLLQRAALVMGPGRVYIAFGGQDGDCGTYHGWVVSAPAVGAGTAPGAFDVTPASSGGAVWDSGSGPAIGPHGSLYVTTGNPDSGGPAPWAESVLELTPGLTGPPVASFGDKAATGDLDLATDGALVLPGDRVFAAGKTRTAFVLAASDLSPLSPIRGQVCGSDPDGGAAFDAALDAVYVPCRDGGIQQVLLGGRRTGWHAGRANSTVVLAGGGLWSLDYRSPALEVLDPATGRVRYHLDLGVRLPVFASLSVGGGLLLVPTRSGVLALRHS